MTVKVQRGSCHRLLGQAGIDMVSAWATALEARYFISSLEGDARRVPKAVCSHWGIENSLHWVLDIAFAEDHRRVRKDNGPANFASLRRIALNLLKQETTVKAAIKAKRLKAGWDESYWLNVLFGLGI